MKYELDIVCGLSNGTITNNLEWAWRCDFRVSVFCQVLQEH